MTFGQFFSSLRARWLAALLVLALTVAATVAVSLLLPKRYTATASVVIDAKPDPVSAMMFGGMVSPAFMATQVDIILSDRVAQRVVRNLKLGDNPQIREQWRGETDGQGSLEVWLAETLQKSLDVKPSRESNVINLSYKATDPRFAAGLANAFMQAYIDTSVELRVNPAKQYSGFFDVRAKEARVAVEAAQARLSAFQRSNNLVATDERLDVENSRLGELSSQLVVLQALAAESTSRQGQANSDQGDRIQEVLNNSVVSTLKADISRSEGQLQSLSARYGDAHPQVAEAKANIAELRKRMEAETKRVTGGVSVSNTINRQREAQVRIELEAQRSKVLRLKALRDEGSVIQRDVENAQRAYDAIFARLNQSSLESQTTQSNVNVLTQATAPLQPSSPRVVLNTLLAVFVGTLLAIAFALLLELRDRRVRTVEDIVAGMGLPVIGMMHRPTARNLSRKFSPMQKRLMAPLPTPKGA